MIVVTCSREGLAVKALSGCCRIMMIQTGYAKFILRQTNASSQVLDGKVLQGVSVDGFGHLLGIFLGQLSAIGSG